MFCKKDVLYFLAGAAAMNAISHIALAYAGILPIIAWGINWTSQLNTAVIAISAFIALVLLYLARADRSVCHYNATDRDRELARERALKDTRERELREAREREFNR